MWVGSVIHSFECLGGFGCVCIYIYMCDEGKGFLVGWLVHSFIRGFGLLGLVGHVIYV